MSSKTLSFIISLFVFAGFGCNRGGPDTTAHGSAAITWSITKRGLPVTCANVGAASASLLLHTRAGSDTTAVFACSDMHGTTSPITAGAYDVTLTLRAADGAVIASSPTQTAVAIGADQTIDLTPAVFSIVRGGNLTLTVETLSSRANCTARSDGGAGTSGNVITLTRADGGCAPVTFVRTRGGAKIDEYKVNCSSPQVASCIERDETLTAQDLDSGHYVIQVTSLNGAVRCSTEIDVLSIPASTTLVKRVQLALNSAPGC